MEKKTEKIAGIILAAGTASRMGSVKQLLQFQDRTILGQVVQNTLDASLHEVIVVLGHCADEIKKTINLSGVNVVVNDEYNKGQSSSLIKGLEAVSPRCSAAMFLLGDLPLVNVRVINSLVAEFGRSKASIVIPTCNGKRGNPVIISRSLFYRLESLTGDTGARVLFEEFKQSIKELEVNDEGIHVDVDTWEDYENMKQKI